jgi:ligand-binding SRPBCC domain-containing protein
MATYSRRTRVAAPLAEVWEFHSRVSGLEALTPEWMGLEVEAVRGPDGDPDPEVLTTGSQIRMSLRPFGIGPRQRWVSRIVEREESDGSAMFRDDMVGGPFATWVHTHRFYADGDETILVDEVEYELPGGPLGRALSPFAVVGFEPMFRGRHRKTKSLLE